MVQCCIGTGDEGYGAVLKAIVWMLLIAGILITCPDLVMAGTVGLSCVFMLMLALEKGWYQVAVTKVMTGISISVVGVPVGILAYFFFFGAGISEKPYPGDVCSE